MYNIIVSFIFGEIMSNMPDITKIFVGAKLPGEIVALAKSEARRRKMTLTDFLQYALQKELELSSAELDPEDAEWLVKEILKNAEKRKCK